MSEEITLQELLPNEFYLDKEGNIVAEISLKQINQIGDILVNYHKENERLNKSLDELEELCKNKYYEKNTTDIDSIVIGGNLYVFMYKKIKELREK